MIYVNGRFLLQNLTGVNRFAYELCRVWAETGVSFALCCPPGKIRECYDISNFKIIVCGCGKSHVWEQLALPLWFSRVRGKKILVCFTGLGPLLIRKKIMTIHDLAFMVNPKWYSRSYRLWYRLMTPLCAFTSMKILTVSEFSKSEIMQRLSISNDKICVVYNAVSPLFHAKHDENCWAEKRDYVGEKYILAVSSIDPRKNFSMLLKAFSYVNDRNIKLYIVGGQSSIYSTSIAALSKEDTSERIKWLGRVSDQQLKWFYTHALCFVYPSLYEGFGIPPLEAMSCGTPTIVSAISVLKEVCGDAALYVNPHDEKDIADKINQLAHDENLCHELKKKGRKRCVAFSWERSAALLANEVSMLLG